MMKNPGQRYVQYINKNYRRSGTLWEGRFRSCLAQEEEYVLACYRYIELNPVRAGMVSNPSDYPWSSYRFNALGEHKPMISQHYLYTSLGKDKEERQSTYRELFRAHHNETTFNQIRKATNGNYALGNERFQEEVEATE